MSGLGGNVIFLAPILDGALIFCVQIPLVYEHLFYKYFVRRSDGQATKGKRASLLMDVFILVFFYINSDFVLLDRNTKTINNILNVLLIENFKIYCFYTLGSKGSLHGSSKRTKL